MATMSDASAADSPADIATELARERTSMAGDRTIWAADRTLMAWIRTSLSLIGFGFAVGQGVEFIATATEGTALYESARFFGLSFISLGVVALAGAVVQHLRIEKRQQKRGCVRVEPWPIGPITAVLLLAIGAVAFVMVVL
jgi:putative membrane protein